MRDKERIDVILNQIQEIWERFPDLRLGQLIGNVAEGPYLYYIEDDQLVEQLKKTYDNLDKNNLK